MNEQVYKKRGRRYEPVGYSDGFIGFPTEGIWLVQKGDSKKSEECIMRIGELQDLRPAVDLIVAFKEKIVKYMTNNPNIHIQNTTYNDFVNTMLKEITK